MNAIPFEANSADELLPACERQRRWRLIFGGGAADGVGYAPDCRWPVNGLYERGARQQLRKRAANLVPPAFS